MCEAWQIENSGPLNAKYWMIGCQLHNLLGYVGCRGEAKGQVDGQLKK